MNQRDTYCSYTGSLDTLPSLARSIITTLIGGIAWAVWEAIKASK